MAVFTFFVVLASLASCVFSNGNVPMPPKCEGKAYCTLPTKFHSDHEAEMDRAMKKSQYWGGPELQNIKNSEEYNYSKTNINNCRTITEEKTLYIIKVDNINQAVLQTPTFTQKVKFTTCETNDAPCFEEVLPYRATCRENQAEITLFTFVGGNITKQPFSVPVSCSCIISNNVFDI